MKCILGWNGNLGAIFEANLTFKCQSLSSVFVGAVDTILRGLYRELMLSLWFKK